MLANLPALIIALLILVAGLALARLARRGVRRSTILANRLLDRALGRGSATGVRISLAFTTVSGEIVFWVVLALALLLAASVVGIGSLNEWLNQLVVHLPSLIIGAAILVVGYFLSVYLREIVSSSVRTGDTRIAALLGRILQVLTLAVAVIIGLDQAGIEAAALLTGFAIVVGGVVFALAAAFAAGSRGFVGNLIAAGNARQLLSPGMRIRVDGIEGELLEISRTHLALDTEHGKLLMPAGTIDSSHVIVLTEQSAESSIVETDG